MRAGAGVADGALAEVCDAVAALAVEDAGEGATPAAMAGEAGAVKGDCNDGQVPLGAADGVLVGAGAAG